MTRNIGSRGVLASAVGAALAGSMLMPAASASEPPGGTAGRALQPGSGGTSAEVTLITGDVVHWRVDGKRHSAIVEDDGDDSTFQTIEDGDDYYVIPSEVSPLVGSYLDKELFNVAGLVKQGYTDTAVSGIPVIVQGAGGANKRTPSSAPGLTKERTLSSINAVSGTIKAGGAVAFGNALSSAARAKTGTSDTNFIAPALPGVQKVWLDRKLHANLEESVPQTGAPEAWKAGYDGTGSTVAVLDTGFDESHPDLTGRVAESKNFTADASVADGHGHGTHVASTVAGSGAASNGLRKGVAPGAKLAIGKVLDSKGDGTFSDVIAGMEWAANLPDVDAISMSLGGEASDGSDPVSQAVNTLTATKGKLFVIAAGNSGPGKGSVEFPGTADAALTVGAVDKKHALAYFSSRGPRLGNYGIKPEITAPGVGIKAARAKGTAMGTPVDENYTSANGTSMATPHVAGAVAILKQQHPDWDPATLKSALINSATPKAGLSVFEQGGGELNVAQAFTTSVVATPGALSLGNFTFPHTGSEPVKKKLTYTNKGTAAATVNLKVDGLVDGKGAAAPEGMVTVTPATVSLAPGASTDVEVTLNRSLGSHGLFSGSILATDAGGKRISGTPIGFNKEEELYTLTIKGTQRDGTPATGSNSPVSVLDAIDRTAFGRSSIEFVNGVATVRVPPSTYSVMAMITTGSGSGVQSQTVLGQPEVTITKDTELTFDARQAKPITVSTPYKDAKVVSHAIQYNRTDSKGRGFTQGFVGGTFPLYVAATAPVTLGAFNFASKFEMSAAGVWMDLNYPSAGTTPANPSYVVNDRTVATLDSSYYSDTPDREVARAHAGTNPWESAGFAEYRMFSGPVRRVELVTGGDTVWYQAVDANSPEGMTMYEPKTKYRAGDHLKQSWFGSPRTPSLDEGNAFTPSGFPNNRKGNLLSVNIFEWGDSNVGEQVHFNAYDRDTDTAAFQLFKDGELYAKGERAFGTVPVPAGKSRLRFELDVAREGQAWWTTSTKTHTAWEFDSDTTSAATGLPLLQIGYDADLDLANTTRNPKDVKGPFVIGLDVRQPRTATATKVKTVKAWLSYDDGKTWTAQPVKVNKPGQGRSPFELRPEKRTGGGFASMKIEATDDAGNAVTQEVTRAYQLHP